jgi:putative SOS response-associated peptidase YedK
MCGRVVIIDSIEAIERRFNAKRTVQLELNYNLSPGQKGYVITSEQPHIIQSYQFGLTPSWAKKQMYTINARAEGDHNPDDDPTYTGAKGIIEKPMFRKLIRSQRCMVIVSAFIEGPKLEKLDKPYLVYLRDKKRPFALAGVYDQWESPDGVSIDSFSIITTTANQLLQKIGHHRMPVILHPENERTWLNSASALGEITRQLQPYPHELMNAYPISSLIKNPRNNSKELLQPVGEIIEPDNPNYNFTQVPRRKKSYGENSPDFAERHKKPEDI